MSDLLKRPDVLQAIELYALHPEITADEVAREVGVSKPIIYAWRKNPNFVEAVYSRYMVEFGGEIPAVLQAMIREARAGNVQAGRLVLEHSGKLVKNINVTIDSPYEKFLKSKSTEIEYEDAEVEEIVGSIPDTEADLPERNTEGAQSRTRREKKSLKKAISKASKKKKKKMSEEEREFYNKKRREWESWVRRAKKIGVEPLPARRPTPAQRKAWINEVEQKENEQRQG